jgi:hypothetical protein
MDGVFSRARPTKLHVYVDETVRDLPDRRRLLGAGALIVTEPVEQELIERTLWAPFRPTLIGSRPHAGPPILPRLRGQHERQERPREGDQGVEEGRQVDHRRRTPGIADADPRLVIVAVQSPPSPASSSHAAG